MFQTKTLFIIALTIGILYGCTEKDSQLGGPNLSTDMTIDGEHHFVDGYEPAIDSVWIRMVVEIPTGTAAKWEVNKITGNLDWEIRNGAPRVVKYLGYPGNYGMIPQTLLDKNEGGDGDPLDVICLGIPVDRGSVIAVKLVGILKLLDGGEQDDKLIAVPSSSHFDEIDNLIELDQEFKGISTILETWFSNYKGPDEMEFLGFGTVEEAKEVLQIAMEKYISS